MNERIRELAEQAGLLPKEIGPVVETRHMKKKEQDLEKFAELIVNECAKAADEGLAQVTMKVEWPSYHIKKHFGVEE
jgi:hypothetical protein